MLNSKMYKKYYPIKSSFDIANMNVAEQKKLIYWIKSLSEDIRLHNTNAVESGRERTTLTDSRIKLVLSDRLFKSHFVRWG